MQMPIALYVAFAWGIASIATALLFGAFVRAGRPAGERDE